ncbi:MAG: hypothetical protein Q9187_008429 [Circinaria calcarea]
MESAVPPSYDEAITRDHWSIIARYIDGPGLCEASLVSKRWHQIFAPHLWGNPASHFGTENDRVYVALTRFKRALPIVRTKVRELTHTLHLPPAQSEIYEGPKNEWLRDVLEQLPNLQSLIVSQLPFFDHSALLALRQPSTHHEPLETVEETQSMLDVDRSPQRSASITRRSISSTSRERSGFPLRLLIATHCANTTSTGLAEALSHWTNLVFLDLSETLAARDHAVLSSFRHMPGLQILKLRHVNLRDEDIDVLAEAIGIRVRSLDVRDNKITDTSIRKLLSACFPSTQEPMTDQGSVSNAVPGVSDEDWPCGIRKPISYLLDEFRGDDIDQRFVRRLTSGVVSRLPSEDLPAVGLTHLYVANNYLTVEGIASLIKSGNLNVLDVGAVDTAKALVRPRARSTSSRQLEFSKVLPGAEKIIPILGRHAAKNLTQFRQLLLGSAE